MAPRAPTSEPTGAAHFAKSPNRKPPIPQPMTAPPTPQTAYQITFGGLGSVPSPIVPLLTPRSLGRLLRLLGECLAQTTVAVRAELPRVAGRAVLDRLGKFLLDAF